jgi:hypothetical protein
MKKIIITGAIMLSLLSFQQEQHNIELDKVIQDLEILVEDLERDYHTGGLNETQRYLYTTIVKYNIENLYKINDKIK